MLIAVLSDIHGNVENLKRARKETEEAAIYICCGDIQDEEVLEEFAAWKQPVYLAWGNADVIVREKKLPKNVKAFEVGELEIDKLLIGFVHFDFAAVEMANEGKYDVIFYGHTHTPWIKKMGKTTIINPGEIAGQFGKPSFALFDTKKLEPQLKVLE